VYVVGLGELVVLEVEGDGVGVTERVRVPWTGPQPDWEAASAALWGDDVDPDEDGDDDPDADESDEAAP
jgi:hypothetical protein